MTIAVPAEREREREREREVTSSYHLFNANHRLGAFKNISFAAISHLDADSLMT